MVTHPHTVTFSVGMNHSLKKKNKRVAFLRYLGDTAHQLIKNSHYKNAFSLYKMEKKHQI